MQFPDSRAHHPKWMLLYKTALAEADESKRLSLIGLAKGAIFRRKQELAHLKTAQSEEWAALEDADYVLAGLRRAAEFNRKR